MLKDEKQILWKLSAVLLGMSLPLRLFGPVPMAICLFFGIVLGLFATKGNSLRSTVNMMRTSLTVRLTGLLLFTFLLSAIFSIDQAYSFSKLWQLVGVSFFALLLYMVFREMPVRHAYGTLKVLSVTTLFMVLFALVDALFADPRFGQALHGEDWANVNRLNFMSSNFAVLLPFVWAWLVTSYREHVVLARWFAWPIGLITFVTAFICGGRAGWVGIVIAAFAFLLLASKYHHFVIHRRHWFYGILAVVFSPVIYGLSRGMEAVKTRLDVSNVMESSGRLDVWSAAMKHMFDNPITGIGLNAFRKLPLTEYETSSTAFSNAHLHNFVLQLGLETGILGLAVGLVLSTVMLVKFWRMGQGNLYGLAGFCSVLAFFVTSLANTSIFQAWWLAFLIFSAIFAVRIGWMEK